MCSAASAKLFTAGLCFSFTENAIKTHIIQGYFTYFGILVWLPYCNKRIMRFINKITRKWQAYAYAFVIHFLIDADKYIPCMFIYMITCRDINKVVKKRSLAMASNIIGTFKCNVVTHSKVFFVINLIAHTRPRTVYPKTCAHVFVVICFAVVMQSFIMNSHEVFIHICQGCFAGNR